LEAYRNPMRKNITPDRIMNGEINYSYEDFIKGLWKEVESSMSRDKFAHITNCKERNRQYKESVRELFSFVYEICLQAVLKHPRLKRILEKANDEEKNIVQKTLKSHKDSIELSRAIFLREISVEIEKGLTKRQAAKVVVEHNKNILIHFLKNQATSKRK